MKVKLTYVTVCIVLALDSCRADVEPIENSDEDLRLEGS